MGRVRRTLAFLVVTGTSLVSMTAAEASFPGQPVSIRFMRIDSDYELLRMRADGTSVRRVTSNLVHDADARVSPGGGSLVFWRQPPGEHDGEIFTMWWNGTHVRRLTFNDDEDQVPNWSPDGARIVFRSDRLDLQMDLYTMAPDGTGLSRLTRSGAREWLPTWSPDGAWIAFSLRQTGADWEVARIRPNGTGLQLLTSNNGIDDLTADWSPDGSRLAIWSDADGDFEIYTLTPQGTRHRVTSNRVDDVYAFWLSSGGRIVFNREDALDYEIHSIKPTGAAGTKLTGNLVEDYLVRLVT
jgi:Tol biopolymer transport system component